MERYLLTKKYIRILFIINSIVLPFRLFVETRMFYSPYFPIVTVDEIRYFFMSGTLLVLAIVLVLPFLYRAMNNDNLKKSHLVLVSILIAINLISFIVLLIDYLHLSQSWDPVMMFFLSY